MGDGAQPGRRPATRTLSSCPAIRRRLAPRSSGTKARAACACACSCAAEGQSARALAIVCPGRTESIEKYFEVTRDLQARALRS